MISNDLESNSSILIGQLFIQQKFRWICLLHFHRASEWVSLSVLIGLAAQFATLWRLKQMEESSSFACLVVLWRRRLLLAVQVAASAAPAPAEQFKASRAGRRAAILLAPPVIRTPQHSPGGRRSRSHRNIHTLESSNIWSQFCPLFLASASQLHVCASQSSSCFWESLSKGEPPAFKRVQAGERLAHAASRLIVPATLEPPPSH